MSEEFAGLFSSFYDDESPFIISSSSFEVLNTLTYYFFIFASSIIRFWGSPDFDSRSKKRWAGLGWSPLSYLNN